MWTGCQTKHFRTKPFRLHKLICICIHFAFTTEHGDPEYVLISKLSLININISHIYISVVSFVFPTDFAAGLGLENLEPIDIIHTDPVAALMSSLRWTTRDDAVAGNKNGWTLLQYACFKDDAAAVAKLVQGPDTSWMVNTSSRSEGYPQLGLYGGLTPLHAAMSYAGTDVVVSLLEAGAVPTARCSTGHDPFMTACQFGRADLVDVWLQYNKGWDLERVDDYDSTVLNTAVYFGGNKTAIVRKLLEAGADLHLIDSNGVTLLMTAMANEDADMEMLQLLVEALRENFPTRGRKAVGINTRALPRTRKKRWLGFESRSVRGTRTAF